MYLSLLKMNYDGADLLRLTPFSWIIYLLSAGLLQIQRRGSPENLGSMNNQVPPRL